MGQDLEIYMSRCHLNIIITNAIEKEMERQGMDRIKMADKMGGGVTWIEGVLDGEIPISLDIIARFSYHLNGHFDLSFHKNE